MKAYQSTWLSTCWAVAVLGVCFGLLFWSPWSLLGIFTVSAAASGVVSFAVNTRAATLRLTSCELTRVVSTHACAAGFGVAALVVYGMYLDTLLWPTLLLTLVSSPWVVRFLLRRCSVVPQPKVWGWGAQGDHGGQSSLAALELWVRTLGVSELCSAWSSSYISLQAAISPTVRGNIVALRQAYLDEIERRNPCGFRAWLDSGARVASNPRRFLSPGDQQRHTAD